MQPVQDAQDGADGGRVARVARVAQGGKGWSRPGLQVNPRDVPAAVGLGIVPDQLAFLLEALHQGRASSEDGTILFR